jgi:putative spermidine/putrescine transport system substrate-binding protein
MNARTGSEAPDKSRPTRRTLYHLLAGLTVIALALGTVGVPSAQAGPPVWRDEFNSETLDPAWYWLNENPDKWKMVNLVPPEIPLQPTHLRIETSPLATGGENLLLRTGAEGNFTIETRVLFEPVANYQLAGLVIFQDQANFMQLGRAFCNDPGCVENGIYFDNIQDSGLVNGNFAKKMEVMDEAYLRLELKGRKVTAFYSKDGRAWQKIGQHTLSAKFQVNGLGLTASQDFYRAPEDPIPFAAFDYFLLVGNPKPSSPFVGHWTAIDYYDATEIDLAIGGPPGGPFQIRWKEDYISFCGGGPGLARGTGQLSEGDPHLLEASMHLECSQTGDAVDFEVAWRYDLATNSISWTDWNNAVITWHRSSLVSAARREGGLTVIALPEDWCNYGTIIQGFTETYGIPVKSVAPGASSADELQAIRDGGVDAPDVIDVGPGFAAQAKDEGLVAPYRVSAWNTIPDVMKDVDAYWYGDYYGLMAIAANTNTGHAVPSAWDDLLTGESIGETTLFGDPRYSNMAFFTVYGAALAREGGSLDNVVPGVQFFRHLYDAERLAGTDGNADTLASGATPVVPEWSYLALAQRDSGAPIAVVIPQPAIAGYYAQAISAYAPHPNAARLWMEYLYSNVGQRALADGYCTPARFAQMNGQGELDDLLWRLPAPEDLENALFPSVDQAVGAQAYVEANWQCTVYGEECPPPTFVAYVPGAIEGYGWPLGDTIGININGGQFTAEAVSEQRPEFPEGETRVLFVDLSLQAGDRIVMTDTVTGVAKDTVVTNLAVTGFDLGAGTVSGDFDPSFSLCLWVWLYDGEGQELCPETGTWMATFDPLPPGAWGGATQWEADGDGTSIDFQVPTSPRSMNNGSLYLEWSPDNPEEVVVLRWNNSVNLTNSWGHPACQGDLEYFGNSWVSENEGGEPFFFASLVGWGTTGDWTSPAPSEVYINSISSDCPGSASIPVHTEYRAFGGKRVEVYRVFGFGDDGYAHDVRPFIPRLSLADGYSQVLHPDVDGDTLVIETTDSCDYGCRIDNWNGSWFAIHNPTTGLGMIAQHKPSDYSVALWIDQDGGSNTNASSVLLLQPEGGFKSWVPETEYLCFYDSNVPEGGWEPSLTLPDGCQP